MSRDEILAMEPGRELDALVELNVFDKTQSMYLKPRPFSTDISAAFELVEKMSKKENVKFGIDFDYSVKGKWNAGFNFNSGSYAGNAAQTAPEAICKAALLTVMHS